MPGVASSPTILVEMTGVTKRFGPVTVLRGVDFTVWGGEVHVLAGENGAGKSTLMKILGGVHTDFEGTLTFAGRAVRPRTPLDAAALGVAVIHQELSLIGPMSVADNLFLGRTPTRAGWVDEAGQRRQAHHWLGPLGLELDVRRPVESFPLATQQLIEIAKALSQHARVLVMDEPTSALSAPEVDRLFALIRQLTTQGCGIVYITHRMEEIARIAQRITVLRDGQRIGSAPAAELPPHRLLAWMVGREMTEQFPRHIPHLGPARLRLESFSVFPSGRSGRPAVQDVSLTVRAGEIVGLGGLQGSGASELLLGLFGAFGASTQGAVWLNDQPVRFTSPRAAIARGVALLTNDRKASGLVLSLSIIANTTLAALPGLSPAGWRRPAWERQATQRMAERLGLRAASIDLEVGLLSGGNQQKVALAKWLQIQPQLLLLDEPTRGVDVGAKQEIYALMNQWTSQGIALLLITSEMPELLALSDRVVVLHRGRITAEYSRAEATPDGVLAAAMGHAQDPTVPATPGR
jgi:ABC-type sugar transport system ATPase subunit